MIGEPQWGAEAAAHRIARIRALIMELEITVMATAPAATTNMDEYPPPEARWHCRHWQ